MPVVAIHFDLPASDGTRHRSEELTAARATVLLFVAADCPISNRYSPMLHQMETQYGPRGIRFLAVFSDATTLDAARKHLSEFGLEMPGLLDPAITLARQTGAHVTPEAVVLSAAGSVLYRGRIDDRYVDWGKTRASATQADLADALDAVLSHRPVPHPVTKALGCAIAGAS